MPYHQYTGFPAVEAEPTQTPTVAKNETVVNNSNSTELKSVLAKSATAEMLPDGTDLNRLAYAISMAETADCTTGIGPKKLNCFGIKGRDGNMKTYSSKEEAYADFKRIWSTYYKRFPDEALSSKWTGNDSPDTWLQAVKTYY